MTKKRDMLTIDYDELENHIDSYVKTYLEHPVGLVVDNLTVWSLIGKLQDMDGKICSDTLLFGVDAFKDTKLRGLQVIVKIPRIPGQRFADLIGPEALELELGAINAQENPKTKEEER